MPYVNYIPKGRNENRFTPQELMDILLGQKNLSPHSKNYFPIRTIFSDVVVDKPKFIEQLSTLLTDLPTKGFLNFRIPKHSGGFRLIEAPVDDYKARLSEIGNLFYRTLILPHQAAFAYTRGRCAYDALVVHQQRNARWFLKVDLKDFFPSISKQVLKDKLPLVYPFNLLSDELLEQLCEYSVNLRGVLPQGSPLSPLFSNLIMQEFDVMLTNKLHTLGKFTYTRYADDIIITSPYDFNFENKVSLIRNVLHECNLPIYINSTKTRYASAAGRNWNLGLMYNKDSQITIGHAYKNDLSFKLNLCMRNYISGQMPEQADVFELVGKIGYLKTVEPIYYETMIKKYEKKYNTSYVQMIKDSLRQI